MKLLLPLLFAAVAFAQPPSNPWVLLTAFGPPAGYPLGTDSHGHPAFTFNLVGTDWDQYISRPSPVTDLTNGNINISVQFTVLTGNPSFQTFDVSCGGGPAIGMLYFHAVDANNYTNPSYRWWYKNWLINPLAPGLYGVTAYTNDPGSWINANGETGVQHPTAWTNALKNPKLIGMTFGTTCYNDTGVATQNGTAEFSVVSFSAH